MKRRMLLLCLALASVTASPYSKISDDGYGQRLQKNAFGQASASAHAASYASSSAGASASASSNANAYDQRYEQQADYGKDEQSQYLDQQTEDTSAHGAGNSQYWWMGANSPFDGHKAGAGANANAHASAAANANAHFGGNPFLNGKGNSQANANAHASATGHVPSHDIELPYVSTASKNNVFPDQQNSNGFEVTCSGKGQICVPHHLCKNGRVSSSVQGLSQVRSDKQNCDVSREVCCTMSHNHDQVSAGNNGIQSINVNVKNHDGSDGVTGGLFDQKFNKNSNKRVNGDALNGYLPPSDINPNPSDENTFVAPPPQLPKITEPIPTHVQLGCAAALICVEENLCGMDGMINPSPLALTEEQLIRRVPLSDCKNPDTGIVGKCCRDPNYVDPWPTGNLPANYTGGFDEQGFPKILNVPKATNPVGVKRPPPPPPVKGRTPTKNVQAPAPNAIPQQPQSFNQQPTVIRPNVPNFPTYPKPFNKNNFVESPSNSNPIVVQAAGSCGVKNSVQRASNLKEEEVGFGEIPWEAMILYTPEKKLLCSGAFVAPNAVLTAARCFDGYRAHDIAVKAGEWKLGYELKHEEPLPFEIVKVKAIVTHPGYLPGSSAHDVAFLYLEHDVHLDSHVGTICLQDDAQQSYVRPGAKCISTGWGKHILQAHLAGAIMHSIEVDAIEQNQCRQRVSNAENPVEIDDTLVCVKAHQQKNNMCQVDIGGPLACEREDGTYELVGVYTQDTGCLPTNQVATFGLIDVPWVKYMLEQPASSQPAPYTPQQPQQSYEQPQKPQPYAPQQPQQSYEQPQQSYEPQKPKPYTPQQPKQSYESQQPQQSYEQPQKPQPYTPQQPKQSYEPQQPQQSYEQPQKPEPYAPQQPKQSYEQPQKPEPFTSQQSYEQPQPYTPQQPEQSYEKPPNSEPFAPQQPDRSYEQPPNPESYAPEQPQQPEPYAPAQKPEQYVRPQQPKPYKPAQLPFEPAQKPRPFAPPENQYPQQSQPYYYGANNNNQQCDCQKSNLPPYGNQYLPPN